MNLLPSADQEQILDTIRAFLGGEAPVDRLRRHGAIGNPDAGLWSALGELGLLGLSLPEEAGGIGLGAAEEFLFFRELGRHLVSPAILGLTLGARLAAAAGNAALRDAILSGQVRIGLGNPRGAVGEYHLFDAAEAPWILVVDDTGVGLYAREQFATIEPVQAMDAAITLERARLEQEVPRFWLAATDEALPLRALLLLSAYSVGLGEGARDMAVGYAQIREQFGKPIGSFQAIKHICADMAIRSEAANCQASLAALVFDEGRADREFHVIASKLVAAEAALKNAAANIQVHGAFGFTAEADAHHYLKRAHLVDLLWGNTPGHRSRLLALPPAA